ncbi:1,2-phenylacetyl-CoA epoxidase, subunit C [bacterium HR40]|nr:1,2-phenylacetyl-CoA epoxidase, subunit C [bacterium HR40]
MPGDPALFAYVLRLGDDSLILAQRLSELVGKAPELEEEMALINIALDLVGRARLLLTYAGEIEGAGRDEDALAYRRDVLDFRNHLLVELPNGDFAHTIGRLFLVAAFDEQRYGALRHSADARLREIADKAVKETAYHLRHAGEWVIRLGDGTEESHRRMQTALDRLWMYTGELFAPDSVDEEMARRRIGPDLRQLEEGWNRRVNAVLAEATLDRPQASFMQRGGKDGRMHTEHLGYILAEMQFLQRAYPDATSW